MQKVTSRRYLDENVSYWHAKSVRIRTETKGFGAFKTMFVMLLIALNFAVVMYLYMKFMLALRWYLLVSFTLSFLTCIYVLSTDKNGQSKSIWIIILLLGFSCGYLIYFLADENVFFFRAKKKFKAIFAQSDKYIGEQTEYSASADVVNNCKFLSEAGGFRTFTNTDVKYFPSGASFFDDALERINGAKKFVFIEFFIIADGVLFNRAMDILERKAREGVDIRIIYDDLGSHRTLSIGAKRRIRAAGIKLRAFNRLIPRFSVALNYRDHRKIIVVDGETAYTGGCNLADEYINEKRMHGYWKDVGLRMDGCAADGFTVMFLRQWEYVARTSGTDYGRYLGLAAPTGNTATVTPYADGPEYKRKIAKNVYCNIIAGAKERLYIMTPYFITEETLTDLLINKVLSGVDVRIILPEIPDKKYVYAVTRNNAERLIDYGVKIYCLKNSFVHAKVMMSEEQAAIGSVNIDLRSFYQQFECAALTDDKGVLGDIGEDFARAFADCERIYGKKKKRNNFVHRVLAGFLRLFAPLM